MIIPSVKGLNKKWMVWVALGLLVLLVGAACRTGAGSREFIPNRGWTPN